jgi:hypothetical protein
LKRIYSVNLLYLISLGAFTFSFPSFDFKKSDNAGGSYVKPSVNYKGQTRKEYVRKKVSMDKNALKNYNHSWSIEA